MTSKPSIVSGWSPPDLDCETWDEEQLTTHSSRTQASSNHPRRAPRQQGKEIGTEKPAPADFTASQPSTDYFRNPTNLRDDSRYYGSKVRSIEKFPSTNRMAPCRIVIDDEYTYPNTRADNQSGNNSDSQDLISPSFTPPSPPPPVLEDLIDYGQSGKHSRSSREPSTVIGKSSERKKRPAVRLDMLSSSNSSMGENTRLTSHVDVIKSQQGVVAKTEQLDYAEDLMQSIQFRVLKIWQARQPPKMGMSLSVPCNVRGFMEKQFQGSNKSLGQVIVLSGTATYGQATTCSDYIHSNWPLRGPGLLNMLQLTFDGCGKATEGDRPL